MHISALERFGQRVSVDGMMRAYKPKNLEAVIPRIWATYSDEKTPAGIIDLPVVDWSGQILDPGEPVARDKVLSMLNLGDSPADGHIITPSNLLVLSQQSAP